MSGSLLDRVFLGGGAVALALAGLLLARSAGAEVPSPAAAVALSAGAGQAADSVPQVAILLREEDCSRNVDALAAWNELHASGRARVVGIVTETEKSTAQLREDLAATGIGFPLVAERDRAFRALVVANGYRETPVVAVLDPAGKVRLLGLASELPPSAVAGFAPRAGVPGA